jgi:hypothetical protein
MTMTVQNKKEKQEVGQVHELSIIEQVVIMGDLAKLSPEQRVTYYKEVCKSAGLNPYTKPFDYITLNGKLTLYAKKDCTEQLRKLNGISIEKLESHVIDDLYIVKATARTKDGRMDQSTGAVTIGKLTGDAKANAIMKAETKAKRRVTLSISGMGFCDETEIETIPSAQKVHFDLGHGEITPMLPFEIEQEKPKELVSEEQAQELQKLHDTSSSDTQEKMNQRLKDKKINSFSEFPLECFEITRSWLKRKSEEYQASLKAGE